MSDDDDLFGSSGSDRDNMDDLIAVTAKETFQVRFRLMLVQ